MEEQIRKHLSEAGAVGLTLPQLVALVGAPRDEVRTAVRALVDRRIVASSGMRRGPEGAPCAVFVGALNAPAAPPSRGSYRHTARLYR